MVGCESIYMYMCTKEMGFGQKLVASGKRKRFLGKSSRQAGRQAGRIFSQAKIKAAPSPNPCLYRSRPDSQTGGLRACIAGIKCFQIQGSC